MYDFEVLRPLTVDQAVTALKSDDAVALSGGQTLIPTLKQRLAAPERVVSLSKIPALADIIVAQTDISIGAMATHASVAAQTARAFPALAQLAGHIGDPAVRNRGTLGGSLANNDPAACYPAAVLATAAIVATNARNIAADDFFAGMFETALDDGEIITQVAFPIPTRAYYAKFDQPASRFAMVGVFVAQYDSGVRVAVTGASEEGVCRWTAAETALSARFSADAIADLQFPYDGVIADIHGSADYRAHLVGVMTRRAVAACQ